MRPGKKCRGRSPYARHAKKEYLYSQLYRDWASFRRAGQDDEARRLGAEHTQKHLGAVLGSREPRRWREKERRHA